MFNESLLEVKNIFENYPKLEALSLREFSNLETEAFVGNSDTERVQKNNKNQSNFIIIILLFFLLLFFILFFYFFI